MISVAKVEKLSSPKRPQRRQSLDKVETRYQRRDAEWTREDMGTEAGTEAGKGQQRHAHWSVEN